MLRPWIALRASTYVGGHPSAQSASSASCLRHPKRLVMGASTYSEVTIIIHSTPDRTMRRRQNIPNVPARCTWTLTSSSTAAGYERAQACDAQERTDERRTHEL
ncbi:hypothetical protein OH76DRAFT_2138 [Lentinus brumalis]|uniref:Uncharacterized protein n=1 Tax=Lentinus brumalis TaxID=2498619 RepID=A0A371DWN7_9APHY|nr:hypothetical protein OH76DRAFT_2138 [Polyporus brumalis]